MSLTDDVIEFRCYVCLTYNPTPCPVKGELRCKECNEILVPEGMEIDNDE